MLLLSWYFYYLDCQKHQQYPLEIVMTIVGGGGRNLENILVSKYSILQRYKMLHRSVLVSMKNSQEKKKRERMTVWEIVWLLGHWWPHILSSMGAEVNYTAHLPICLPLPLFSVRGILLCEQFAILQSKKLLFRPVVRFLVSTIGYGV